MLHPTSAKRVPYITECLDNGAIATVSVSDYVKFLPDSIAHWIPGRFVALGTDGFGRSDTREALRDYFEVDNRYITLGVLSSLAEKGKIPAETVKKYMRDVDILATKKSPRDI
jgi:pyruvate dehydrogenase E1 component